MKPLLLLLLGTGSLLASTASTGDDGFRIFQDSAPEFVRVEISDVQVAETRGIFSSNRTRISASGRVIEVIRSASGLAPGSVIEIRYEHQARGGSSAETPPILQSGTTVPAFLARKGTHYTAAARHHSFSEPSSAQMKRYDLARIQSREAALADVERRLANLEPRPAAPAAPTAELREPAAPVPAESSAETLPLPAAEPPQPPVAEPAAPSPPPRAEPVVETTPPAPAEPVPPRAEIATPELPPAPAPAPEPEPSAPVPPSEPITPRAIPAPPATSSAPSPGSPPVASADDTAKEGYTAVFSLIKQGEAAQLEGRKEAAREAYIMAREKLIKLKAEQPDFQPFMVEYRMKDLKKRLEDLDRAAKP